MTAAPSVAALLAVDPSGLGGITLRARAGPDRDAWLRQFRALLPPEAPWRKLPSGMTEGRLIGGLDLVATLAVGRPVAERGLLAEADGGFIIVPMAERLSVSVVGPLAATLDAGVVRVERDGVAARLESRFGLILLDEGIDDESASAALMDRTAFVLELATADLEDEAFFTKADIAGAKAGLVRIEASDAMVQTLCEVGLALGVPSLRIATFALKAAKAAAALAGRDEVSAEDIALAATLVIAPRATSLPPAATPVPGNAEPNPEPGSTSQDEGDPDDSPTAGKAGLTDQIVEAAKAAIPAGLLAALGALSPVNCQSSAGRAGAPQKSMRRGRPAGVRRGTPGHGVRLALVETLRAAAPWQAARRAMAASADGRVLVRREDFRVARFKQRSETTTIFVVDASGSAALNRLAEVKGAVELVLAECYVRRDSVALIAFRGTSAELILPPTRALARAKRALAGQPGGGGTPLATAIDAAVLLGAAVRRKGAAPLAVFLTDGRANVGRSGRAGRIEAEADAMAAAMGARDLPSLVIDISPRPNPAARDLAAAMGARYQPLPYADATSLSRAVLAASDLPHRDAM